MQNQGSHPGMLMRSHQHAYPAGGAGHPSGEGPPTNMEMSSHGSGPWAKSEQVPDPSSSSSPSNFGASSNNYPQPQQQQQCYYPGYGGHNLHHPNNGHDSIPRPDSTDYHNNNATSGFYHPHQHHHIDATEVNVNVNLNLNGDCTRSQSQGASSYYPPTDHSQFYDHHHHTHSHHRTSNTSCALNNGPNFYGGYSYNQNQGSHHHYGDYPGNNGDEGGETFGNRSMNHNGRYFDPQQDGSSSPYFPPYPNSRYPANSQQYNNSQHHHHHGGHHHPPPFRRKSMESYVSEGYNTNNKPSFNNQQQSPSGFVNGSPQPQPQPYCSPAPSPSSSTSPAMTAMTTMIKRECLSNPSPSIPIGSPWVRNSSSNSSANCSSTSDHYNHNPNMYNPPQLLQQNSYQDGLSSTGGYHPQQQQQQQLSSCAFQQQQQQQLVCSDECGVSTGGIASDMKLQQYGNNVLVKPGQVKHQGRSLSIPAALPSSSTCYGQHDEMQIQHHLQHQVQDGDGESSSSSSGSTSGASECMEKVEDHALQNYSACHGESTVPCSTYDYLPHDDGNSSYQQSHHPQPSSCPEEQCPGPVLEINQMEECSTTEELHQDVVLATTPNVGGGDEPITQTGNDNDQIQDGDVDDDEDDDEEMETSSLLHEFDVDDIPESDMIIAEDEEDDGDELNKSFPDEEEDDDHPAEDRQDESKESPNLNNVISTTGGVDEVEDENIGKKEGLEPEEHSNTSFTLTCGGNSGGSSQNSDDLQTLANCDSGISMSMSLTFSSLNDNTLSGSGVDNEDKSPKSLKRSHSSADKKNEEGVTKSESTTSGVNIKENVKESGDSVGENGINHKNGGGGSGVIVPKGWKREISFAKDAVTVYYVSPSETRIGTIDELKNYICSDGTCKCGLSCPLRLDHSFSFDPKVISVCVEKRQKRSNSEEDDLMYLTGFKEHELIEDDEQETKTTLCNHYKRKIPKSDQDSPLISSTTHLSSTREDLGDGRTSKKRRISDSSELSSTPSLILPGNVTPPSNNLQTNKGSTTPPPNQNQGLSSRSSYSVPVPCSQQSPDTTTQTPQTEMSPASSISSERSFTNNSSTSSSRSLRSTPTPPSSSSSTSITTIPVGKSSPGVTTRSAARTTIITNDLTICTTSTASAIDTTTIPNTISTTSTSPSSRKSSHNSSQISTTTTNSTTHSKTREKSPCPNVDVRSLPPEENCPPPSISIESAVEKVPVITPEPVVDPSTSPSRSSSVPASVSLSSATLISTPTTPTMTTTSSMVDLGNGNLGLFTPSSSQNLNQSFTLTPITPSVGGPGGGTATTTTTTCNLSSLPVTMNMSYNGGGFTLSPIVHSGQTMNILNSPLTIPTLELQKLLAAAAGGGGDANFQQQQNHTFPFSQFHQPQVLFSIPSSSNHGSSGGGGATLQQIQPLNALSTSTPTNTTAGTAISSLEKADASDKSPLQLVQDVVNRVDAESDEKDAKSGESSSKDIEDNNKSDQVESDSKSETSKKKDANDDKSEKKEEESLTNEASSDKSAIPGETCPTDPVLGQENKISDSANTLKSANGPEKATPHHHLPLPQPPPIPQMIVSSAPQIFLQSGNGGSTFTTSTASSQGTDAFGQMRYPIIQTIQPFYSTGAPLIISSSSQQQQQQQTNPSGSQNQSNSNQNPVDQQSINQLNQQQQQGQGLGQNQGLGQIQNQGQGQTSTQGIQQHQQPSFIYHQDMPHQGQSTTYPTLLGDPSMPFMYDPATGTFSLSPLTLSSSPSNSGSGGLTATSAAGFNLPGGGKKKKKRLSKKQQQAAAHLQLQQQLLIQQIQAQQQAQQALSAAFSSPLTIFPQSFGQSFNLQPMNMNMGMGMNMGMNMGMSMVNGMNMPFFQPQTILTLPNLILNPADGTLFLQPSAPLSTNTANANAGNNSQNQQLQIVNGGRSTPNNALIAPKKEQESSKGGNNGTLTVLSGSESGSSDDLRRNNPTPDSSTGDQLGILSNCGPGSNSSSTTTTPIPSPVISVGGGGIVPLGPQGKGTTNTGNTTTTTLLPVGGGKSKACKSRAVSSSSTVKRIFHQKQILPKIDSTTPSND